MANIKVPIKLDGIPLVLNSIKKLRREFKFDEDTPEEYKRGAYYAMDSFIETLEKIHDNGDNPFTENTGEDKDCKTCKNHGLPPECPTCSSCGNYANYVEMDDVVNRPAHYTDGKIEVIEFIEDKNLGFHLGNAVKYIARAGKKDPTKEVEDLKKAEWYIKRRIKALEEVS